MKKIKYLGVIFAGLACLLLLNSCIQRQEITQGSIITEEQVAELKLGMSKVQVEFVLGSPSIINPLDVDRWEYVFVDRNIRGRVSIQKGYLLFEDGKLRQVNLGTYFEDN